MLKLTSRLGYLVDSSRHSSKLSLRLLSKHKFQVAQRTISFFHCHSTELLASSSVSLFNNKNSRIPSQKFYNQFSTRDRFVKKGEDDELESLFGEEDYDFEPRYDDDDQQQSFGRQQYSENSSMDDLGMQLKNLKTNFNDSDLSPFKKDLYTESEITSNRTQEDIKDFYNENSIQVKGRQPPKPALTFEEMNFLDDVLKKLQGSGFDRPTPIQAVTWPVTLSGRNVVGIAQTGSGKTLSFLLPAMVHMADQPPPRSKEGPISLILCPTRELAKQCESVAANYFGNRVRTTCLFGGGERSRQIYDLRRGCDLIVATPGRLMDLLADGQLKLDRCSFLVLDEADRMLDMGFEPQIRRIIDLIRPDRQITMWSATWPEEVRELASRYLSSNQDPVHIRIGSSDLTANQDVEQKFTVCSSKTKVSSFLSAIKNLNSEFKSSNLNRYPKILVFSNTKVTCNYLCTQIRKGGIKAEAIHGDIGQQKREFIMNGFRRNFFPVMVATDVAARGLDVDNIDYVINFDVPPNSVSYIHRIGRTARGGKKGTSLTFLTENDGGVVGDIIACVEAVGQPVDEKLVRLQSWYGGKMQEQKDMRKQNRFSLRGYERSNERSFNRRSRRPDHSFSNRYRDY